MKGRIWLFLLVAFPWLLWGCGKGGETTTHKGHTEVKQEGRKAGDTETEMKGLTMESLQKEGKMEEVTPGTV